MTITTFTKAICRLSALGILISIFNISNATFTDGTFTPSQWQDAKIADSTPGTAATYSVAQGPTGSNPPGNPGPDREVVHNYSVGGILVGHWNTTFTYDPSVSGAISTVIYSYDLIHINPPANQAVAYRLLILQGGNYYSTPASDAIFPQTWTTFGQSGLTSLSFSNVLFNTTFGSLHPDFTSAGTTLTFGYMSGNSANGNSNITRTSAIDNYNVTLKPVPEPATFIALLIGSTCVGLRALKKRR